MIAIPIGSYAGILNMSDTSCRSPTRALPVRSYASRLSRNNLESPNTSPIQARAAVTPKARAT